MNLLIEELSKQRELQASRWLQFIHQWCKDSHDFRAAYAPMDPTGLLPYIKGYHCLISLAFGSAILFARDCAINLTAEESAAIENAKAILYRKMDEILLSNTGGAYEQFRHAALNANEIPGS